MVGGGRAEISRMAPIKDVDEGHGATSGSSMGGPPSRAGPAPGVSGSLQTRAVKRDTAGSDDEFADADIDDLWAD